MIEIEVKFMFKVVVSLIVMWLQISVYTLEYTLLKFIDNEVKVRLTCILFVMGVVAFSDRLLYKEGGVNWKR